MTPDEKRVAIAEELGFTDVRIEEMKHVDYDARSVSEWEELRGTINEKRERIPDYLNDLNAMHEAEKVLTMEQASRYGRNLATLTDRMVEFHDDVQIGPLDVFVWATPTAAQRADAFLMTLGKLATGKEGA